VRRVVADEVEAFLVPAGDDAQLAAVLERPGKVHVLLVEPRVERRPREALADVRLDEVRDGGPLGDLLVRTVRQRDVDLGHGRAEVEGRERSVKARRGRYPARRRRGAPPTIRDVRS